MGSFAIDSIIEGSARTLTPSCSEGVADVKLGENRSAMAAVEEACGLTWAEAGDPLRVRRVGDSR
jgi:hypothetical protein